MASSNVSTYLCKYIKLDGAKLVPVDSEAKAIKFIIDGNDFVFRMKCKNNSRTAERNIVISWDCIKDMTISMIYAIKRVTIIFNRAKCEYNSCIVFVSDPVFDVLALGIKDVFSYLMHKRYGVDEEEASFHIRRRYVNENDVINDEEELPVVPGPPCAAAAAVVVPVVQEEQKPKPGPKPKAKPEQKPKAEQKSKAEQKPKAEQKSKAEQKPKAAQKPEPEKELEPEQEQEAANSTLSSSNSSLSSSGKNSEN